MAVLAVVLIWGKRKYLAIPFMMLGIYLALGALPEQWFGRMNTIETYEADTSAMERIEAWRDGYQYALHHPLLGVGWGWSYVKRDWHSSYIEILAEHGFRLRHVVFASIAHHQPDPAQHQNPSVPGNGLGEKLHNHAARLLDCLCHGLFSWIVLLGYLLHHVY